MKIGDDQRYDGRFCGAGYVGWIAANFPKIFNYARYFPTHFATSYVKVSLL
jgi:hypothetical protein